MCIVDAAAKGAGIDRWIVYHWKKNDSEFAMKMNQVLDDLPEMMENKMKELVLKGDGSMIRFWLGRRHPDYKQKIEHSGVVLNIYGKLTDEQKLERLRRSFAARGGGDGKAKLDLLDGGHIALPENGKDSPTGSGEIKGSGDIEKGIVHASPGPLENNGNNDQLQPPAPDSKPEPENPDNQ